MYTREQKQVLVTAARSSIQHGLQSGKTETINVENYDPELQEIRATFVTLKIEQSLRGCIGTLEGKYPLIRSVAKYAYAAAFRDPRFKPLSQEEFEKITLSISILTPAEIIKFDSESDLINQLVPDIDGLIIKSGNRGATFLPAVWESLPNAEKFLSQLKAKAQIRLDESIIAASRYEAVEICEKDFLN